MFPAKLLFLVPHIMQITPSTQQLLHILLPSIWLSLLCSVTILTASRCSWPSPSKGHAYLYLVILGNFNSIDTAHSFCRQDLNCIYLFSRRTGMTWHSWHSLWTFIWHSGHTYIGKKGSEKMDEPLPHTYCEALMSLLHEEIPIVSIVSLQ